MKNSKKIRYLVQGALIAAVYVVLTYLIHFFGLDSGVIQVRISEALTALLYFTPAAIPGLFLGCFLSNILVGGVLLDVIFGSLATLIGALAGYMLRKKKYLVLVPSIISNMLIVPFVLKYVYAFEGALWYFMVTVGIGEFISCGILGAILLKSLEKRGKYIFK